MTRGPGMTDEIWDRGLQSERTRLAWVRTAVALSTGGLGAIGLSVREGLPVVATAGFALATLCGGVLLIRTRVRFRRVQAALHAGTPVHAGLDALFAWLGTLSVVVGAFAVVFALR
jgi:putative membrane protein